MKKVGCSGLTYNLFVYPKRMWYKNLFRLRLLPKRVLFLLKHGYSPVALFETFSWFICVMREILTYYLNERNGTPVVIENYIVNNKESDDKNTAKYNATIREMLSLLDLMDESNALYEQYRSRGEYGKVVAEMEEAKDKFFKLFAEYFYRFWD